MSEYQIFISDHAQRDIKEIINYLSLNLMEPLIAKNIASEIDKSISSLKEMPQSQSLVLSNPTKQNSFRKLPVKNYIIFFEIHEEQKAVGIVRILYGRRNWENMI